jgi:ferredoxin
LVTRLRRQNCLKDKETSMSKVRVRVDETRCIGAGQCVLASPEVFDQREEDGIVVLLQESPDETLIPSVKKAAKLCPAMAILLEEA